MSSFCETLIKLIILDTSIFDNLTHSFIVLKNIKIKLLIFIFYYFFFLRKKENK